MCGIAGFETRAGDTEGRANALITRLANRGPDGSWWQEIGDWAVAQTRLAVIDLSPDVRYPMQNEDGRLWLLFNGEVYNHHELRQELEGAGHRFRTACDAEVALHGYEQWGDSVFSRLNGMWAIALLDRDTCELTLARDARGIKPLVTTSGSGPFAFASDALALVSAGLSPGLPDNDAIAEFVAFHYVPGPATGIEGVKTVEPGTVLHRARNGDETVRRWAPPVFTSNGSEDRGHEDQVTIDEARSVLKAAIARQLRADVPVGIFLSGGIDSALVLRYALEVGVKPVAFTIGFAGSGDYDESKAAASLADSLGVEHRTEAMPTDFAETVDSIGMSFDRPLADPSAIATLPLARLARREVTVALSGTGGDDLFAGYYRHRALRLRRFWNAAPRVIRRQLERASTHRGEERRNWMTLFGSYLVRMSGAESQDDHSFYLSLVGSSTSPPVSALLYTPPELSEARERVARRHALPTGDLSLDELQDFELATYLPGDLLVKEDRATMAHSLEGRVPLLDDELVRLAARTECPQRATARSGKVLLRKLARRDLGPRVAATRKRGFAVPLGALFRSGWDAEAAEWLSSTPSDFVDPDRAAILARDPHCPPLDIWALVALSAWERELARARADGREFASAGKARSSAPRGGRS